MQPSSGLILLSPLISLIFPSTFLNEPFCTLKLHILSFLLPIIYCPSFFKCLPSAEGSFLVCWPLLVLQGKHIKQRILKLGLLHMREFYDEYYSSRQNPVAGEVAGPVTEPVIIILLNSHIAKLTFKYFCLYPYSWSSLSLSLKKLLCAVGRGQRRDADLDNRLRVEDKYSALNVVAMPKPLS